MDLTPYIGWIVFIHVLGAFVFAAGHGVSMFVAFQVRRETDRARMAALLDVVAARAARRDDRRCSSCSSPGSSPGIVLQSFGRGLDLGLARARSSPSASR